MSPPPSPSIVASPRSLEMKGNTGVSAKKRRQRRVSVWVIGVLMVYVSVMTIYQSHFAGMWVPDISIDEKGRERIRRRPSRQKQRMHPDQATTSDDAVLEGFFTLVDISISPTGLQGALERYEATATFCNIDWKLQQRNPSNVAMFRDLRAQSKMCDSTMVTVDLYDMVTRAKAYDAKFANATTHIIAVPPTGVVFHETRCGSTLTANLLAGFAPKNSRVYSESPPPVTALKACDVYPCNPNTHTLLIQDVFYMMGRTTRKERPQHVFYKIQSIGAMNMDKFTEAFPTTPWVFLYRDSVEVMQSHIGKNSQTPVCARSQKSYNQPHTTQQIVQKKNMKMADLSQTEYCAAHLAGLSLSAIQEHQRSGKGRFVNYNQLPGVVWDKVLPQDFGISVEQDAIERMTRVAAVYSKGRGVKANQEWQEDSTKKQSTASKEVVDAVRVFLADTYDQMEALSLEQN